MSNDSNPDGAGWIRFVGLEGDGAPNAQLLAAKASYSVAQFYRRFLRDVGQSPLHLRKRLLLERAAFELSRTSASVSEIGFKAKFVSAEGFSRSFKRVYGVSPTRYRELSPSDYRLDVDHPVHFRPSEIPEAQRQGDFAMNLLERVLGAHYVNMKLILDICESLTDDQLDAPISIYYDPLPWMQDNQSLRSMLKHIIGDGSPWPGVAALTKHDTNTLPGLRTALVESYPRYMALVASHEKEGLWDLTFVDSDCEPPMVFSYGGWIGHTIVFQNYRRIALMMALKQIGVQEIPFCDPVDYCGDSPKSIAPWSLKHG